MSRVLVTGAAGFIGSAAMSMIAETGRQVVGIGRGITGEFSDARDLEKLPDDINFIVHAAGGSSVARSIENPAKDERDTIATTRAVLEAMKEKWPHASLVLLSSAAVYGVARSLPIGEGASLTPVSPYGRHKLESERLCLRAAREHRLRIAIVRLFSVYGTGLRKQLLWDAVQKLKSGNFEFAGTGEEVRDWIHVRDAVSLLLAIEPLASIDPPIVNGGSGTPVTVRAAVALVAKNLGVTKRITFSGAPRAGDPPGYLANVTRASKLGWKAQTSLETGVAEYVQWARGAV